MAQQLNLLDARFLPRPKPFNSRHALLTVVAVLALSFGTAQWLKQAAAIDRSTTRMAQADLEPLRQQLVQASTAQPSSENQAELQQLRTLDATQRRISGTLAHALPGRREAVSMYLAALARQANASVWITGLALSEDGRALDLEGRMLNAAALPDYLRRLNAETVFKGRPFAQLNLKSVDSNGQQGNASALDFALRSMARADSAVASIGSAATPQ